MCECLHCDCYDEGLECCFCLATPDEEEDNLDSCPCHCGCFWAGDDDDEPGQCCYCGLSAGEDA